MAEKKGGPVHDSGGKCIAEGCKASESRFTFCLEHFDQFKFGLITKLGKKVGDYEKKWDHYQAFRKKAGHHHAA